MQSRWNDAEAAEFCDRYARFGEDLALRVYTSRLIGREPSLVMHGGGNTSVKSTTENVFGETAPALFVKGSGWNLDTIEPRGLPGLDLAYLRRLRALDALDDESMVNELRGRLFDSSSPNPSVETLLHAFLPHRFIDHSHAEAVLALTNRPGAETLLREIFGARVALVPYVMPGFALAKACAETWERAVAEGTEPEGLVLLKHGLFTFGDTARESYERHIELVTLAEEWLAKNSSKRSVAATGSELPNRDAAAALISPLLRRALAEPTGDADHPWRRMVLEWRATPEILRYVGAAELVDLAASGPLTPDHVLRTKPWPCVARIENWSPADAVFEQIEAAVTAFRRRYNDYFERQCTEAETERVRLDDFPRVVLVPGLGMFCAGATKTDACAAADLYEQTIRAKLSVFGSTEGPGVGFEGITERDLFDIEYWPLEQAKLGKRTEKPLARQVAVVTGAAGAIGSAVAERLIEEGAHVVLSDLDAEGLAEVCEALAEHFGRQVRRGVVCDVTDEGSVAGLFEEVARLYGGCDLAVVNAGVARAGRMDETSLQSWQAVQRVNVDGSFLVTREAARLMRRQAQGGHIVMIGSKNVAAPGAEFSAYSASKAAGHQLARVAALELAKDGIRVNIIAPDAVFGSGARKSGLWQEVGEGRAKAHGVSAEQLEDFYRQRNLLKARVEGRHVGNAVVFFAANQTPTTGAVLPVDGGVAQAFVR